MELFRRGLYGVLAVFIIAMAVSYPVYATHLYSSGGDFDLAIPPQELGKGWMEDATIFVLTKGVVFDVDIALNLTHSSACDLKIYLQSPAGTRVCLNRYDVDDFIPFEQDFLWTIFDDEAQVAIEEGRAPFTGRFRPKSPGLLSVFDGENTYGLWRIQIYDAVYVNRGTFHNARLDFVVNPEPGTVVFMIMSVFWRKVQCQRKAKRQKKFC